MKFSGKIALVLTTIFLATLGFTSSANAQVRFRATLFGLEEVPPNASPASGEGVVIVNQAGNEISVALTFRNLTSAQQGAHIHGNAPRGQNAPVLFNLGTNGQTSGTLTGTFPVTSQQVADLRAGLWYFNVHSANFPGGEIRGQIETVCEPVPAALVSWFMGEGNANDVRSRNNGALIGGATANTPGRVGQAFSLNGSNYVEVPDANSLDIANQITIDAWIRPTSIANSRIVNKISAGGTNGYSFGINNGRLQMIVGSTTVNGNIILLPNEWSHVTGVYDGSTVHLYVNGTRDVSAAATGLIPTNNLPLRIGSDSTGTANNFQGLIDEVEIFNTALTAEQIGAISNTGTTGKCRPTATVAPQDLRGWWAGDGTHQDLGGLNETSLQGNMTFTIGKVGQAFAFDGIDDYVNALDDASNSITGTITVEAWINPAQHRQQAILTKYEVGTNQQSYYLGLEADGKLRWIVYGRTALNNPVFRGITADAAVPLNVFTHVTATFNPATQDIKIYINGADAAVTPLGGSQNVTEIFDSTAQFRIGAVDAQPNALLPFVGAIDEATIYDRVLTVTEIQSIYNAGFSGKLKQAQTPIGSTPIATQVGDATITLQSVSAQGVIQEIPIDQTLFGPLPPANNYVSTGLAYDISTSALYSGNALVCFNLRLINDPARVSSHRVLHLENGVWVDRTRNRNFTARSLCASVPTLSPFVIADSNITPAASVTVSGRVTTSAGRGVAPAARVLLQNTQTGETRTVLTNQFGYYRFANVPVGQNYVVTVVHKRFAFAPRSVEIFEQAETVNFTAQ